MRLKIKNKAIYGRYMGVDKKTKKVMFLDKELGVIKLIEASKLEKAHDK